MDEHLSCAGAAGRQIQDHPEEWTKWVFWP